MWLKYPLIVSIFFIAFILQMGFFSHFAVLGVVPNLVFAIFFLIIFFEEPYAYGGGILAAVVGGFLLDATGPLYFGPAIGTLLCIYAVTKTIKNFLREQQHSYLLFYFIPLFLISLIFYRAVFSALQFLPDISLIFSVSIIAEAVYSLGFVLIGFFIYEGLAKKPDRQLKLFI
ncbi:hypothetical protein KW786_03830 [Candidatus Parcubacteria bacterium]|nr:hypothetical protein [Candidatus Parcubacteria bacterium]